MGTKQGRAAETEKPGKYAKFIKGYTAEEIDRSDCWSVNDRAVETKKLGCCVKGGSLT